MAGTPNERGQDAADGPPQDQEPFDSASDPINRFVLVPCFAPDIAIDLPLNKIVEVGRHSHQRDLNDPHISRVQCQFVMQFDRNGIGMVHMQNQGKNASRVISGARQRQARVAKERYCRMVPGDVLELLHDHQGRYAFKLVETSPTPQPRLRDTRLVASFRMFERPRLDIDGPRALPSLEEAKARAELAATEADGRIVLGAGSESEARVRARMRAAGKDAGKSGSGTGGAGMDGLGAGEAGEERAVGGTGADWSSLRKSGVTPGSQKEAQAALRGGAASRGLQALPPGVVVNIMRFLPLPERCRACRLSRRVDRMLSTGGLMDELPLGQLLGGLSNPPLELLDGLLRKSQGTSRRLDFGHCRWATAGHVLAFMGLEPAVAQHPLSQAQGAGTETLEDLQCDAAVAMLKQMGCPGVKPGEEKKPPSSSSASSSSASTSAASKAVPRQDVATAFPRWSGAVGEGVRYVDWWHTIRCGMQVEPLQPKGEEVVRLAHDLAKEEPQDLFEMEELNAANESPYAPDVAANTGRAAADAPQDWLHPAFRRGYRACENPSLEVAETLLAQTQSIHAPEARHNMELFLASHLPHRAEQMGAQIMNPNLDVEACIAVSRRAAVEAYLETRRAGLCPADDDLKLAAPTNEAPNQLPADERCHKMLPATVPPRPADPVRQAPMEGEDGPAAPASGAGGGAASAPAATGPVKPMGPQLEALRKEHEPKADGSGAGALPSPEDEDAAQWRRREAELAWYVRHAPRGSDELASQRVVYYTCACADIFQFPYQLQRIRSAHGVTAAATVAAGSVDDMDEIVRQAAEEEARISAGKAQSQLSLNCLHPWDRRGGLVREEGFAAPSLDYCQHVLPTPASAPTQPHPAAVLSPAPAAGGAKGGSAPSSSSSSSTTTSTSGSDPAARFHEDGPFLPPASEHSAEGRGLAMRARLLHGALPRPLFASGVKGINLHGCLSIRPENLLLIASYAPVLEELDLGLCQQIPNKDLCQLPRLLPNLRRIGLEYLHRTTDDFLEELGKHCPRLEQLLVPGCVDFTDDGFRALAKGCKRMTHIDVRGCRKIDGSGLVAVAKAGAGSLRHLSMCGLPLVTPETMTALVRWSPALESLKAEMWSEEDGEPGPGGEVRKRRSYRVLSNVDSALRYIVATLPESNEDVQELQRSHPRYEDARRKVEERKKRAEEEGVEFEG